MLDLPISRNALTAKLFRRETNVAATLLRLIVPMAI